MVKTMSWVKYLKQGLEKCVNFLKLYLMVGGCLCDTQESGFSIGFGLYV